MAVYKFNAIENNNEEIAGKKYKIKRGSKGTDKFQIKQQSERASVFMQFLILFDRNFKASIRNAVSIVQHVKICKYLK